VKTDTTYEERDGYTIGWVFTPEQVKMIEEGRAVSWYGDDEVTVDPTGHITVYRDATLGQRSG